MRPRRFPTSRRSLVSALTLALLAHGAPLPAQAPPARLDAALDRLGALERQIDEAHARQLAEQARLLKAGEALEANRTRLQARRQLGAEASTTLEAQRRREGEALGSATEQLAAQRQAAREAQTRARRAAGLLAGQAAAPDADQGMLALLALATQRHEEARRVATTRALRLEGARSDAADTLDRLADTEHYYSAFQSYGLDQLREQQQKLVDEVAALQRNLDSQSGEIARLAAQRGELSDLVARLTSQSQATPAPSPTPTPEATPPPAGVTLPALAEVPDEETIPAVQLEGQGGGATDAGPRRLFWHVTPVAVRSLTGGSVVFAGSFAGYRNLLIVDIGGGWHALYGNMTSLDAKVGQTIAPGQQLGLYQAAAGTRAAPFWLEIRRGVQPVAPEECPSLPADWQGRLFARVPATAP